MLKFSGFADLTSCLGGKAGNGHREQGAHRKQDNGMASETLTELLVAESPCMLNASGVNMYETQRHLDTQERHSCI